MSKAAELAALIGSQSALSNRNLVINGAMQVAQRGTSSSSLTSAQVYYLDRFFAVEDTDGTMTIQQSSTSPADFQYSTLLTTGTADASLAATQICYVGQKLEGLNVSHLNWGTANAKTVTLSFWVRSSLTGTFGGAFANSAFNRSYPFTYSISSANTWEYKTITVAGDTTGTWPTDNTASIQIFWGLGVGSTYSGTAGSWVGSGNISATGATSVIGTASATFHITGVQLEVGETATPFEHRSFGDELAKCQRYFQVFVPDGQDFTSFASAIGTNQTNRFFCPITLSGGEMRTDPTLSFSAVGDFRTTNVFTNNNACTSISIAYNNPKIPNLSVYSGGSGDSVSRLFGFGSNTSAYMRFDAEL